MEDGDLGSWMEEALETLTGVPPAIGGLTFEDVWSYGGAGGSGTTDVRSRNPIFYPDCRTFWRNNWIVRRARTSAPPPLPSAMLSVTLSPSLPLSLFPSLPPSLNLTPLFPFPFREPFHYGNCPTHYTSKGWLQIVTSAREGSHGENFHKNLRLSRAISRQKRRKIGLLQPRRRKNLKTGAQ